MAATPWALTVSARAPRGLVGVVRGRIGDHHRLEQLWVAHGQRLRGHAAHRQADEMHRLAARFALDELGRVLRERLDAQGARHHFGGAVVAVVVADHRVGARQLRGHAVPHAQVAAERMAEHDDRTVAFANDIQTGHGVVSFVGC
jgi:hypothetical protein